MREGWIYLQLDTICSANTAKFLSGESEFIFIRRISGFRSKTSNVRPFESILTYRFPIMRGICYKKDVIKVNEKQDVSIK